ncbi:augmin complex subunit dgt5-like [Ochlerotatus camptorhynchus]|uniref:augmin complex subunit dgt5-like n=1 Tax=Ochlerotatus camptorhynchus TaxID=644619 RepID=UPI0031E3B70B
MSLSDEIVRFKLWATKMGCPLEKIPSDESLKKCIRGKQSILFQQIVSGIRPRQEIESMRNNILVAKLRQYEALGGVLTKSKMTQMPEELQRFEKIEKLKNKCSETEARISKSKASLETLTEKIKQKNIQKVQVNAKVCEIKDKLAFYKAVDNSLFKISEKEIEIKQMIERSMPTKATESTKSKSDVVDAIQACHKYLDSFYSKFTELKQEGSKQAQQKLWANIRTVLRGIPNYLLWSALMDIKEKQLLEISEADRQQNEFEKENALSDQDLLQINMAKLCGSHINLFIDLVAKKRAIQTMKDDYLAKYTPFAQTLETKMNLLNMMDDEADEILEDYMFQSTSKDYNQGQLEFISKEIDKKKQEIKLQSSKLENQEQVLSQLRVIYGEIDSYSERIQEEIQQLNQIKEKISYVQRYSRYTVHNMRQKTTNQSLTFLDQSMNVTRFESNALSNGPAYSPASLPPYSGELTVLSETPFSRFYRPSKCSIFSLKTCLLMKNDFSSLLTLLPNCFSSAECSLQEMKTVIKFDEFIKTFMIDLKPEMDQAVVDDAHYQHLWKANHVKICQHLDEIDAVATNTREVIDKGRIYYSFVLANPLREYVPPKKLFNGRNYREYESEYLMYYRMIHGPMGGK